MSSSATLLGGLRLFWGYFKWGGKIVVHEYQSAHDMSVRSRGSRFVRGPLLAVSEVDAWLKLEHKINCAIAGVKSSAVQGLSKAPSTNLLHN